MVPDEGESLGSPAGPTLAPFLDLGEDGTVGVKGEALPELFMQDCDAEAVEGALHLFAQVIADTTGIVGGRS